METQTKEKLRPAYENSSALDFVHRVCTAETPKHGHILDLMCGSGDLLHMIQERAKDFYFCGGEHQDYHYHGVDISRRVISSARKTYPYINFEVGEVLSWQPKSRQHFDIVLCTDALHHLPYKKQEAVIEKIASLIEPGRAAIISDWYIGDYQNEQWRKVAAARLGYGCLYDAAIHECPEENIATIVEDLVKDIFHRKFKTSLAKREPIFRKYFRKMERVKTLPHVEYGRDVDIERIEDGTYVHILKR